ncbi:MAG: DNA polymerase III subunit gamma/tau [Arenibacter latericius]|nr:DNA polymerase III subunit gamma/tau [Arenibacter latericius]
MEPFIVSARKYRPKTFKDVVGQQAITNTLTNAIENNHLAQALLFTGPRGVGKTTCARILAKQINQQAVASEDEDFAFNIFELDAASNNSVDDIRELTSQVRIPPQVGKYKVYIIDEVHMLSQAAFNAFLKTLEEPPAHAIFILATTEKHKIIPTILSRCQIFDFKRITVKDTAEYLKYIADNQEIDADDDALHIIAQKADGAMRDALSIFDRVVSFSGKKLTRKAVTENLNVLDYDTYFKATDLILGRDIPGLLVLFNETLAQGFDGHHFIIGLASHFRDLMVCKHQNTIPLLEVGEEAKKQYLEQSQKTSGSFLLEAIDLANDCDTKYKSSKHQRLLVELTLMKLASIDFDGEKKKSKHLETGRGRPDFIIPASFYRVNKKDSKANAPAAQKATEGASSIVTPTHQQEQTQNTPTASDTTSATAPTVAAKPTIQKQSATPEEAKSSEAKKIKIDLKGSKKRVSGLSLSSLKAKKEHELNKKDEVIDESSLPKSVFTEQELQKHWADFVDMIDKKGQKILASNLNADRPKLKEDFVIWIELPNDTMKKEVEREKYDLMETLKQKLHNHFITLEITVNETSAKKFAFTPEEKYLKLREKNPAIDLLRKEFDLDI